VDSVPETDWQHMMHFFLLYALGIYRAPKTDDGKTKSSMKYEIAIVRAEYYLKVSEIA